MGHYSCYGIEKILHKSHRDINRDQEIKKTPSITYLFIHFNLKNIFHEITPHLYVRISEHRGYFQLLEKSQGKSLTN